MTLEDFKDVYKDKTPVEMLDLLAEQHATWRHDAVAREENRDSIDGGAYYANECRAMEARVEWLMGRLKDALKPMAPKDFVLTDGYTGQEYTIKICAQCEHSVEGAFYCPHCGQAVDWDI